MEDQESSPVDEEIQELYETKRICPRCCKNPRAVTKNLTILPYCRQCSREYQNDRNKAAAIIKRNVLYRADKTIVPPTEAEIEWASEILRPKSKGRDYGDNICPRCKKNYRAEGRGAAYCSDCRREYQRERRRNETARIAEELERVWAEREKN